MKTIAFISPLRIASALLLAPVGSVSAEQPAIAPELHGILGTPKGYRFALVSSGGEHSGWAILGESFAGWKLVDYVPAVDAVVLSRDGRQVTVGLIEGMVREGEPASGARVTEAEADAVLEKMKFEAMWDRTVEEQKKGMVEGLRQQMTAEFTKSGLGQREIDAVLDQMGDAIVAGLQSDAMRQDFARIYTEVYTKDELRGMADFYETAAGKAWTAKQPDVQQKLMRAMMPRVMQGMPAAQKVAADYLSQHASAAAVPPMP